jgi:hypothetical protein
MWSLAIFQLAVFLCESSAFLLAGFKVSDGYKSSW